MGSQDQTRLSTYIHNMLYISSDFESLNSLIALCINPLVFLFLFTAIKTVFHYYLSYRFNAVTSRRSKCDTGDIDLVKIDKRHIVI